MRSRPGSGPRRLPHRHGGLDALVHDVQRAFFDLIEDLADVQARDASAHDDEAANDQQEDGKARPPGVRVSGEVDRYEDDRQHSPYERECEPEVDDPPQQDRGLKKTPSNAWLIRARAVYELEPEWRWLLVTSTEVWSKPSQ